MYALVNINNSETQDLISDKPAIFIGIVFDTTSTNSGWRKGVAIHLQQILGKPLLELACRHHIAELFCGASCLTVYGETTSPYEEHFKNVALNWEKLNKHDYDLYHPQLCHIVDQCNNIVNVSRDLLEKTKQNRDHY